MCVQTLVCLDFVAPSHFSASLFVAFKNRTMIHFMTLNKDDTMVVLLFKSVFQIKDEEEDLIEAIFFPPLKTPEATNKATRL